MNDAAVFGDQYRPPRHCKVGKAMSSLTGFFIAVSFVALLCFALMIRADRVRDRRRAYADSTGGDTGVISSGNDGFGVLSWFGGSTSSSSSDDSCTSSSSSFSGSGDSSCSDGGGGGGDGGGGG